MDLIKKEAEKWERFAAPQLALTLRAISYVLYERSRKGQPRLQSFYHAVLGVLSGQEEPENMPVAGQGGAVNHINRIYREEKLTTPPQTLEFSDPFIKGFWADLGPEFILELSEQIKAAPKKLPSRGWYDDDGHWNPSLVRPKTVKNP